MDPFYHDPSSTSQTGVITKNLKRFPESITLEKLEYFGEFKPLRSSIEKTVETSSDGGEQPDLEGISLFKSFSLNPVKSIKRAKNIQDERFRDSVLCSLAFNSINDDQELAMGIALELSNLDLRLQTLKDLSFLWGWNEPVLARKWLRKNTQDRELKAGIAGLKKLISCVKI